MTARAARTAANDNDCTISEVQPTDVTCMHLSGGDGFVTMADGKLQYIFSFADLTGTPEADAMEAGTLAAAFPAPVIAVDQGEEFYLTLTNVGMLIRPDLFDPHTVHFHGFPNASTVFDGVPDASISINMGASLTYYYNLVEPGTFMYHCHVEATEHMQMGMLGNLYVRPAQNKMPDPATSACHSADHVDGDEYVYNDGDRSTIYDEEYPIQLGSVSTRSSTTPAENVQPLPFAMMEDRYPMLNGRGYPDTVNPRRAAATARERGQGVPARGVLVDHGHGGREDPAAALEPQHHQQSQPDQPEHPHESGRAWTHGSCGPPTARPHSTT